jgi:GAF domain-containing protein
MRRSKAGGKKGKAGRRKAAMPKRRRYPPKAVPSPRSTVTTQETETARLTRERDEALGREKAAAEVLRVISSSPGELEPVFQAMLENATRICEAKFGTLYRFADGKFHLAAQFGSTPELMEAQRRRASFTPTPGTPLDRLMQTKELSHSADAATERGRSLPARLGGARSTVAVPMLKNGELVGAFAIYRQEVRPFTDKQIELVTNFAAQAVIAIENTRLFNELRQRTNDLSESLEQQTATSEVLKVISSSPGELEPVFQAMLANATRICKAKFGTLALCEGDALRAVALHGGREDYADQRRRNPVFRPAPNVPVMRAVRTKQVQHVADMLTEQAYIDRDKAIVTMVETGGARTFLAVPMLKEDEAVGVIILYRQEVRPFTDRQIELVRNFAAQAVIAIENTRLLNELRQRTTDLTESLEQQTATSEVLNVINTSPTDTQPVFNTIIQSAVRLCGAQFGVIHRFDGECLHVVAHDVTPEVLEILKRTYPMRPVRSQASGRAMLDRAVVEIQDVREDPTYDHAMAAAGHWRSLLAVPMLRVDGNAIGTIVVQRSAPGPFASRLIEMLQNFAAQAVIAIENTRLLNELRQSLEQQTATAQVLSVISSSPGNLEPVFEAMLEKAARVCDANFGVLELCEDGGFRMAALHNPPPAYSEARRRAPVMHPGPLSPPARVAATKQLLHVADLAEEAAYKEGDPAAVRFVKMAGVRTLLVVPMLKEKELIGEISVYRQEVHPFTDKQIELVQNFAAQAVIAIENTRLLNELRESLEQQTATSEVLRVISSSPGRLEPVFDAMLENAVRICEAHSGTLVLREDDGFRVVALHGAPAAFSEARSRQPIIRFEPGHHINRLVQTKGVVHIPDLAAETAAAPQLAKFAGARTLLSVPMLKDNEVVGAFGIYRQEVRPFTDKQIAVIESFAAQAVIAIENTRLLNELRESLEQQTATAEVLSVISSSPGELEPVFETLLANAVRICGAKFGMLFLPEGDDRYRIVALHGAPPAFAESRRREPVIGLNPATTLGRVAATKQVVQVEDIRADPAYTGDPTRSSLLDLSGARTMLNVPMLKDDELVGQIAIYRQEVRPFSDKQIELVQNFAAQAVIAIENTRLLNELRESLDRQTATADILRVIAGTPEDSKRALDTIAETAVRMFDAANVNFRRIEDDVLRIVGAAGPTIISVREVLRDLPLEPTDLAVRCFFDNRQISIEDRRVALANERGEIARVLRNLPVRSQAFTPLSRQEEAIGVMIVTRGEVRPFERDELDLMTGFADQAVIAIENARLLSELRQRTDDLSKSLDDLRTAQDRLVQTQKLASLGQLTAGIAHEIKNPLNFVNNFSGVSVELIDELQDALRDAPLTEKAREEINELSDTLRDNLNKIVQHGKRADSIVKNMLLHSREGSGERRSVNVNAIVEESLNLAYHGARAETQGFNVTLERSFDPTAGEVDVFPQEITRVLLNLISNGFYAATKRQGQESGNGFDPTIMAATKSLGDCVEIRIRDNGTGIPPEVREKMFNPFYTTKPAGEGTGLGLSISHDIIVKQHSGSIEVDTEPGQFTEFRIILPRTTA